MKKDQFTAILVDDEKIAINYLCDLLQQYHEITLLGCFTDPVRGIHEINKSKPDVLFLDIQMPIKTGFDIIREVRTDDYIPHVIFTTAYEKYAIRAIKYAALDYLLKPINAFELENAIQKLSNINDHTSRSQKYDKLLSNLENIQPLKFNTSTGFVIIHPEEILYLEASRNYCEIHLTKNRMELVTVNMNNVFKMLSETSFFRISRFHTVNMNCIKKVERAKKECHLLYNGEEIVLKISKSKLKELEFIFTQQTL